MRERLCAVLLFCAATVAFVVFVEFSPEVEAAMPGAHGLTEETLINLIKRSRPELADKIARDLDDIDRSDRSDEDKATERVRYLNERLAKARDEAAQLQAGGLSSPDQVEDAKNVALLVEALKAENDYQNQVKADPGSRYNVWPAGARKVLATSRKLSNAFDTEVDKVTGPVFQDINQTAQSLDEWGPGGPWFQAYYQYLQKIDAKLAEAFKDAIERQVPIYKEFLDLRITSQAAKVRLDEVLKPFLDRLEAERQRLGKDGTLSQRLDLKKFAEIVQNFLARRTGSRPELISDGPRRIYEKLKQKQKHSKGSGQTLPGHGSSGLRPRVPGSALPGQELVPSGPALFARGDYRFAVDFGVSFGSPEANLDATFLGAPVDDGSGFTVVSLGADYRQPVRRLNENVDLVAGTWGRLYLGDGQTIGRFDLHPPGGAEDTTITERLLGFALFYLGFQMQIEGIATDNDGLCALGNALCEGVLTVFAGPRLQITEIEGETDENGPVSKFSDTEAGIGFTIGVDVDVPVGRPVGNSRAQPFLRFGGAIDVMPGSDFNGQSTLSFDYDGSISSHVDGRIFIGAGLDF